MFLDEANNIGFRHIYVYGVYIAKNKLRESNRISQRMSLRNGINQIYDAWIKAIVPRITMYIIESGDLRSKLDKRPFTIGCPEAIADHIPD